MILYKEASRSSVIFRFTIGQKCEFIGMIVSILWSDYRHDAIAQSEGRGRDQGALDL